MKAEIAIRKLLPADSNHVAPLDATELARLLSLSKHHIVAEKGGTLLGYVLAFSREDAYDGEEFEMLRSLIPAPFTYIDQIAVLASTRKAGVGRCLYDAVADAALLLGAHALCCEVNMAPPNPHSSAFHERMGFRSIGTLDTRDGRSVELLKKRLAESATG